MAVGTKCDISQASDYRLEYNLIVWCVCKCYCTQICIVNRVKVPLLITYVKQ